MSRCHKPSDSTGESSVGHMGGGINTQANSEPGPSRRGTSIYSERPPDDSRNEQPEGDEDPSSVSGPSSAAVPLPTPHSSGVPDLSSTRGPPFDPVANRHQREVTHHTDIQLGILVDGKNKGDFIRLRSVVKVC